ncbi:MAG: hypothetical protein QM715_16325 [Nibricoccus sp.]
MKDNRFIELLNLYVDQQLTAAEATELETEIQRVPDRRRTYQQYCRMQKACTQLFEQDRQAAPSTSKFSRALADADRKVIAFPEPRRVWLQRGLYATGVAAMAACVALVFFRASPVAPQNVAEQPAKPEPRAVATVVAKAETAAPVAETVQAVAIPPADPQTREMRKLYYAVLPVRQFVPVNAITTNGEQAVAEERPDFSWMKNMEFAPLRPLSAETLFSETNGQNQQPNPSFIGTRHPVQLPYENSAFQYQKGN